MHRTYKSKREAPGAIDPREAISAGDEKTSAFDAFYIKNIKQTRRELSCYSSTYQQSLPIKKTRKRKFVKRVINEFDVENSFNNEPRTTCLTPDKSIHVNKAPDPFDLLLNISKTPKCNKDDPFDKLINNIEQNLSSTPESPSKHEIEDVKSPTRTKDQNQNKVRVKKKQYKSYKKPHKPTNETNLNNFDLILEQGSLEDMNKENSINSVILNKSLLKRYKIENTSNAYLSTPKHKYKNNRLTVNITTPKGGSPLTSTPFVKRHNGKSIYKFSPIKFNIDDKVFQVNKDIGIDLRNDVNNMTEADKRRNTLKNEPQNNMFTNLHNLEESPLLMKNSAGQCEDSERIIEVDDNSLKIDKQNEDADPKEAEIQNNNETNVTVNLSANNTFTTNIHQEAIDDNPIALVRNISTGKIRNLSIDENKCNNASIEKPFLGITINERKTTCLQKPNESPNSSVELLNTTKSPICSQYIPFREFSKVTTNSKLNASEDLFNSIGEESNSIIVETRKKKSVKVVNEPFTSDESDCSSNEQFYDACNISSNNLKEHCINQPTVQVEKIQISDKMFNKTQEETSDSSSIDSIKDLSNNSIKSDDINTIYLDNTIEHNLTNESDNKEDKYISFVTTRRRNEITNNTIMFLLDNSNSSDEEANKSIIFQPHASPDNPSMSTEECISHKLEKERKNKEDSDQNCSITSILEPKPSSKNNIVYQYLDEGSADEARDVVEPISSKVTEIFRPSIVLQPGKKWERSLSIYRRMTINENFDTSILDKEHLSAKGRKYRESVINTMELQDHRGSVYNDLQLQRKSSIIPKSYRPSVKLAKEPNSSRYSICTTKYDDLSGFLSEDCDETLIELSKLSLADSDHEITILEKAVPARNFTARDYVLRRCNQTDALLFDECYPDKLLKNCHKIGEGVYGEVFLWRSGDGGVRVLKVVPIAGHIRVNGEQQKDFHEIISEIVIAMELSALRAPIADINRHFDEGKDLHALDLDSIQNATDAFNEVLAVKCVFGSYPSRLLDLWDLYDECKGSENDNPAILPSDQQYIVLELANAGQDLESYQFNSAEQAYALFIQVAFALAVGEEAFQFEHRDLHWGNVLISPTEQKFGTFILRGTAHRVPRCGVRATIIDYSLSRLSLPLGSEEHSDDSAALYNDLAQDDGLFDAVGDYQFQVYRLMRDKLGNDWKNFEPSTNILWLHYTVDKMITALRYKRTNTKIHKQYIAKLKGLKNRILNYDSAVQFVLTDNEY